MSSQLIELLNIQTAKKGKLLKKTNQNFILELLKQTEPKKAINLLKNLNFTKEEIKKIISKLPKKQQKLFLSLLKNYSNKKILLKELKTDTEPLNPLKNQPKEKIKKTELENRFNLHINIQNSIKIKTDISVIKKKILSTTKIKNGISEKKIVSEIKNANSIKELISIANKNGLNIKKIIYTKPKKPQHMPQPKIHISKIQNKNKIDFSKLPLQKDNKILKILLDKTATDKNLNKFDDNKKENPFLSNISHHTEITHKIIKAKESIKHFAHNLKNAIENYKPPISKLSIELHPKELGRVEVTLIQRGDNLQINIHSNNNVINFFNSYQTELKNTLINMGYNGIDMNFNSNQNKENQEKKAYKQYSYNKNKENYDEMIIEIPLIYA